MYSVHPLGNENTRTINSLLKSLMRLFGMVYVWQKKKPHIQTFFYKLLHICRYVYREFSASKIIWKMAQY